MTRISGVVVAANESERIGHALACLTPWCDEVIVVDQASEDDTVALAEQAGARVIRCARMGSADPGRPLGVEAATGDYVLIVDADESVHPTLAASLREIADAGKIDVVWVPRLNIELGHWMRFGHSWPSRKPRFFRVGSVSFRDKLHEGFVVREGSRELKLPADPKLALWHFSYASVEKLLDTVNRYTTLEAQQRTARGRRPLLGPTGALRAGAAYLWREYLRGGGYRDGTAGLIVALARGWYRFLIEAKRWDQARLAARKEREVALRRQLAEGFSPPPAAEFQKQSADGAESDPSPTNPAAS